MESFKYALNFLTFLKWRGDTPSQDELHRSLAYFPVVGILLGAILVYTDQLLSKVVPLVASNVILLLLLFFIRLLRKVNPSLIPKIISYVLKFFLLLAIPHPFRWITLTFMTTFSSATLALFSKRFWPELWNVENALWSSLVCVLLSLVCGPLGIFVLGMSAVAFMVLNYLRSTQAGLIEEGMELVVLLSVVIWCLVLGISKKGGG